MKNILKIMLMFAVIAFMVNSSFGAGAYYNNYRKALTNNVLGGHGTPYIYSGTGTLDTAKDSIRTGWMQIGYIMDGNIAVTAQRLFNDLNPEFFTFEIAGASSGDSIGIEQIRFESAIDTTGSTYRMGCDSDIFVVDGNSAHNLYLSWVFEDIAPVAETAFAYKYPIRIISGDMWVRFVIVANTTVQDDQTISWRFNCEH